jgi:hypothetical protein
MSISQRIFIDLNYDYWYGLREIDRPEFDFVEEHFGKVDIAICSYKYEHNRHKPHKQLKPVSNQIKVEIKSRTLTKLTKNICSLKCK